MFMEQSERSSGQRTWKPQLSAVRGASKRPVSSWRGPVSGGKAFINASV